MTASLLAACATGAPNEQQGSSISHLEEKPATTDECNPMGLIAAGTGCDDRTQNCVKREGVYVCVDRPASGSSSSGGGSEHTPVDCSGQGDECGPCAPPSLVEDCTVSRGARCVQGYCVD